MYIAVSIHSPLACRVNWKALSIANSCLQQETSLNGKSRLHMKEDNYCYLSAVSVEFSEVLEGCVNEAFGHLFHSLTEAYHSAAQRYVKYGTCI